MKNRTPRKPVLAAMKSIGLDLGAEQAVARVVERDGSLGAQETVAMEPDAVRRAFGAMERATVVLEACNQSGWVSRLLEELGHVVLTCNPRRLKIIACSTLKTDALDAEALGRLARLAQLDPEFVRPVTVRTRRTQLLRSELRGRDQLVGMRTKSVNFVRSVLRSDGLPVPKCDADRFVMKLRQQELPEDVAVVLRPQLELIESLTAQLTEVSVRLQKVAAEMPEVQRMKTVDGVGLLTALSFALCVEDPARFERSREVGPYLGLVPRLRQSSSIERRGGITKQGDVAMRRLLVQAALVLMRSKRDSRLKQWALRLAEQRGRKIAVVALARKLSVVLHHLWATGESYEAFPALPESKRVA